MRRACILQFRETIVRKYDLAQIFEKKIRNKGLESGHIVLNVSNYLFKKFSLKALKNSN